jgi:hypothetical protein
MIKVVVKIGMRSGMEWMGQTQHSWPKGRAGCMVNKEGVA